MRRLLIALAALAASLMLAGCGGDGYGGSDSPPAAQPSNGTGTVSVEELGDTGRVLVDSGGRALYAAQEEADGGVVCSGECTSFWIPLTIGRGVPKGDSVQGQLGVDERGDGSRQVTFEGERLYTFSQDEPGRVTGDGLSDAFGGQRFTWHVVRDSDAPDSGQDDARGGSYGY